MPKRPVQHTTGPGLPVKENPLKNANLQWRRKPVMDNKDCRQGCCRTSFPGRPCFNKFQCSCHMIGTIK